MGKEWTNIRGIDQDLYRQARISALETGKAIGVWLNEAIKDKLKKEEKRK